MSTNFLAAQFARGNTEAPASRGDALLMPTTIKSGRAVSLHNGVAHLIHKAAIATDHTGAILAARWACGGGSVNAVPATPDGDYATCANCAEGARFPRGPVVYRCYAADGDLIYIGSTVYLHQRIRAHRAPSGSPWWDEVVRIEPESYPTESAARMAEAKAISRERPFYNRNGTDALTNTT